MMDSIKEAGSLVSQRGLEQTNVNLPNLLTLARILLIPVFVVLFSTPTPERSLAAALVFVVAAVTDLLDGYLARRRSQVTKLGRLLDPIADKLLVLSGLILLVQFQRVAAVIAILIIAREVAVTGVRAIAASEGMTLPVERTGKYKMTLQVIAIVFLILQDGLLFPSWNLHLIGTGLLYLALALGLISGGQYFVTFWRQVRFKG
ncbi:MAG: CDP-diacylglycerol--glycerol-3-phosphate 3-phosphatidyltransferase [Nitrospiraceae bacterium]